MPFSAATAASVLQYLELRRSTDPFGYVVTPNVDHVLRNWRDSAALAQVYEEADLSLCDSRILATLAGLCRVRLPVIAGSDLTALLFKYYLNPYERLTIIGDAPQVVAMLRRRYPLHNLRHHNPPMGFVDEPSALLEAARFVERFPARFILLAVGSPQQEMLAHVIKQRGRATGTALCIGASLLFLTGGLRRAPVWMQRARIEWLHRLTSEPRRLWRRYLVEGPHLFGLAARQLAAGRSGEAKSVQVSIVIPSFRREHLLPRLLERCVGQGGLGPRALEIIVVDNTPEATARAIIEPIAASSPVLILYLHEPRPGISHARNRGVEAARGEFIAFIDDDELPASEWFEALLETQRTYHADVVLGPVRPVFDRVPPFWVATFRSFFAQTSAAPTGTSIGPNRAIRAGRGAVCYRPLASNNALRLKARCFDGPEPFDLELGLTGGEDTLFFTRLHRAGRRIVWCREALVHECIARERLTPRFLLRRKFRDGQITASTCLRLNPPAYGELGLWFLVALAQLGTGVVVGAATFVFNRRLSLRGFCTAATGLGKILFKSSFRRPSYGARPGGGRR